MTTTAKQHPITPIGAYGWYQLPNQKTLFEQSSHQLQARDFFTDQKVGMACIVDGWLMVSDTLARRARLYRTGKVAPVEAEAQPIDDTIGPITIWRPGKFSVLARTGTSFFRDVDQEAAQAEHDACHTVRVSSHSVDMSKRTARAETSNHAVRLSASPYRGQKIGIGAVLLTAALLAFCLVIISM